jgi:hypothetical protein
MELVANGEDDDHILALYRNRGYWGACAKSNFSELRGREPVYRTVRELALSYFAGYFDEKARHTLRGFTLPLDLRRFRSAPWLTSDRGVDRISDALDALRRNMIVTRRRAGFLPSTNVLIRRESSAERIPPLLPSIRAGDGCTKKRPESFRPSWFRLLPPYRRPNLISASVAVVPLESGRRTWKAITLF